MEKKNEKIVCVHLLNDFSGSPLVFSQAVRALVKKGYEVDLYTSKHPGEGFLSGIEGVNYQLINYKWSKNKALTLMYLLISQLIIFLRLLKYTRQDVLIYINTVLPFGAALAGKATGKKVLYHLHETSIKPPVLKKFLFSVCDLTAKETLYVSQFLAESQELKRPQSRVIPNALSEEFEAKAHRHKPVFSKHFNVLMLGSLKIYKGIVDYVMLAKSLPDLNFELVINADQNAVDEFFKDYHIPQNLKIYPTQKNVHPFYEKAHLVLNLSHPDKWLETFGMTALEAMSYSLPVIVPPLGGIAELVEDDYNGYKVDVREAEHLRSLVKRIASDEALYYRLSQNALMSSNHYSMQAFENMLDSAIKE